MPCRLLLLCAWLITGPVAALAHGPAPAALQALSTQEGRLEAIRTNIGLVTHWRGNDYRYLCPAQWGGTEDTPLLAALPDGQLVAAPPDGLWVGDPQGCAFEPLRSPEWGDEQVVDIAIGEASLYVLTRVEDGSRLWLITGGDEVYLISLHHFVGLQGDSVVTDALGRIYVAGSRPTPWLQSGTPAVGWFPLSPEGWPEDISFLDFRGFHPDEPGHGFVVAALPDRLEALATRDGGLTWTSAVTAETRLHGPVRQGEGWLALAEGVLHQAGEDGAFAEVGPRPWTCLQRRDGQVWACNDFGFAEVGADLEATPRFAMTDIAGVDPACPGTPEAQAECKTWWIHFGAEGGLLREAPDAGVEAPDAALVIDAGADAGVGSGSERRSRRGGCQAASAHEPFSVLGICLCIALGIRRRLKL